MTWSEWQVVHNGDRIHQYISIVSTGDDNEVTDQSFWIYFRWKRKDERYAFDWARVLLTLKP